MNGIFISQCCGCAGKQCTRRYNFDDSLGSMDVAQFRAYDDPGGTTPVTVYWDYGAEELDIDGEGCYAVEIIPASVTLNTIHVAAMVSALTTGSVGVTIRRPESNESISLWWLGGTSYELRHGTTVIESITHTAATDEIKLELTTPKDPTTDVLVYIGGTLVHTETAVAFIMPDVLNLGVAIDGEATVDWVEVSPCPVVCNMWQSCLPPGGHIDAPLLPATWGLTIPKFANESDVCEIAPDCQEYYYSGDFVFSGSDVSWFNLNTGQWVNLNDSKCEWVPIVPGRHEGGMGTGPPPEGRWGRWFSGGCPIDHDQWWPFTYAHDPDMIGSTTYTLGIQWQDVGSPGSPSWEYRFRLWRFDPLIVEYVSAWLPIGSVAVHDTPVTLNHVQSPPGCISWPATLDIIPNGPHESVSRQVSGCETGCTPPVTPQPGSEYFTWITFEDEDGGVWEYPTCLGISFNDVTGSWEWSGSSVQGHVHPTCGALPDIAVKIHCVEPQEGAAKQWVLDITTPGGTARIPQVEDPELGYVFEGTANNMCVGETWNVAATPLSRVDPETSATLGGCPQSPCTALWLRGGITIGCADSSYVQSSAYLSRMAKGNIGSPPSEWTVPGVDPALIVDTDVYGGIFPFGGGSYRIWVYSVSGGSYQVRITGPNDELITATGEGLICTPGNPTLNPTSAPYDWFGRPGGDPFGVCPPGPDESAFIDFVWF